MKIRVAVPVLLLLTLLRPLPAAASLTVFQTYVGNFGVSTDGFGSLSQSGIISADVPVGATVVAAYLYTSSYSFSGPVPVGGTLGGSAVAYGPNVPQTPSCCGLQMNRADVTGTVAPIINGGLGGVYNFTVTETDDRQDGEGLVVVYSLASLPTQTVGILDGFSNSSGDTFTLNTAPLDPTAPGFVAEMRLGTGFSCCSQTSSVTVNGTTITTNSGNNDDGDAVANGSLITVGGFDDPYSPFLPSYAADHERYNLTPEITLGDTSIVVNTLNPSGDDNIFLSVFLLSGAATINQPVPEPATWSLMALGGLGLLRRRFRHS